MSEFYNFKAVTLQGKEILMEQYRGKVVLIVNTASKCGFTPQFEGLEKLYEKHKDKGFEILGFPCNQFANQEPGSASDIINGCMINYGVTFQMFEKIKVNGIFAHPLYKYLKKELPGMIGGMIKWNFTKFLIDRSGKPVARFAPSTTPEKIEEDILKLL